MWNIVKNGTKRRLKISNNKTIKKKLSEDEKDEELRKELESIRKGNKKLYKFWVDLASYYKLSVFIYNDKSYKIIRKNIKEEQENAQINNNVIAILGSGPSFDSYRSLYGQAKNKTVEEVIKNYKKYFHTDPSSGKFWYV